MPPKPGSESYLNPENVHTIDRHGAHARADEVADERLRAIEDRPMTGDSRSTSATARRERLRDHIAIYTSSQLGAMWDEIQMNGGPTLPEHIDLPTRR